MRYKVSIVTINYNDKDGLEKTIKSVLHQDYDDIEFVLVDGGSTDGSLDVIRRYGVTKFVSETDRGIYDAMNKGLKMATGDFVGFMNSGDIYHDSHVISDLFAAKDLEDIDIIYGDCVKVSPDGKRVERKVTETVDNLQYHPIYRHGASFTRLSFHVRHLFDLSKTGYGYALDFFCIYSMLRDGARFKHVDCTIMDYLEEGVSNNVFRNIRYNYLISVSDCWNIKAFLIYIRSLFVSTIGEIINFFSL